MAPRAAASVLVAAAETCSTPARTTILLHSSRHFSTSPSCHKTSKMRSHMYDWYERSGDQFKHAPATDGPNYMGHLQNQPFPLNPLFRSQPVLDESMREEIFRRVTKDKMSLKSVSADLGVDVRRVAAVIRMKTVERQWEAEGKTLAKPYANAILKMLPKTSYQPGRQQPHEPVNDMHVHKLTMQQLFVPVSESRHFTREDAASAFHRNLLPADERSAHPQLITLHKANLHGVPVEESVAKFRAETKAEEDALIEKERRRREQEESRLTRVNTERYQFRFQDINAEAAGKNGRGRKGVGWRYGVPFYDRKKGQVKIPTSVP